MPTSGDLKSGDCLFFTIPRNFNETPPPHPQKNWPSPQWEWPRTLYDVLHDAHTIKIRNHCFGARNNLCQWLNTCNAPETVLRIRKIQVLSKKWAKSQTKSALFFTKYSIFIVDVKSGRFMYQSGRAGDEAKKRKSPAKSGRVSITA